MDENFKPFKDRAEHDYLNRMTVLLAQARLVCKNGVAVINQIQETTEEYLELSMKRVRQDDN